MNHKYFVKQAKMAKEIRSETQAKFIECNFNGFHLFIFLLPSINTLSKTGTSSRFAYFYTVEIGPSFHSCDQTQ